MKWCKRDELPHKHPYISAPPAAWQREKFPISIFLLAEGRERREQKSLEALPSRRIDPSCKSLSPGRPPSLP